MMKRMVIVIDNAMVAVACCVFLLVQYVHLVNFIIVSFSVVSSLSFCLFGCCWVSENSL